MRIGLISALALPALAIAGCSQRDTSTSDTSPQRMETMDVSEPAAPGVRVTAAPGVAFAYHYEFRLPPARIAAAQETHATACEKLGIARCRITGMRFRLVGENDVQGMMAFKLDPTLARAFGKSGIAAIEAAQGKLIDAEITGTDAGAEIAGLAAEKARAGDELRRLDTQLGRGDLPASERAEPQRQRAEIAGRIASNAASTSEQRESLANTPMTFDYSSGPAVRGFDPSAPLTSALDTAIASAQTTLALLLGFLAIFGPPAILVVLIWLLWRRVRPLLPARRKAATTPERPSERPEATISGA